MTYTSPDQEKIGWPLDNLRVRSSGGIRNGRLINIIILFRKLNIVHSNNGIDE